jgi:tetratricopeptide (TPR) repeat protein
MRLTNTSLLLALPLAAACVGNPDRQTLARLRSVEPDLTEVQLEGGLEQAMRGYRKYLESAPASRLTPEAMRRLADLKLEKEYGYVGEGPTPELPVVEKPSASARSETAAATPGTAAVIADRSESDEAFERRAASEIATTESAIELYDQILSDHPTYAHNDRVLYQKARAYDELGRTEEAIAVIDRLIAEYPHSRRIAEVQFRRAEYFFTRKKYLDAEESYLAIIALGTDTEYYELALYKLGWTFYKQELHEEALQQYIALLDHKVSNGYDFDQSQDETEERRVADTYRVISLSFSSLGGAEVVEKYFSANGQRSYEDRIYSQLGEFYLEKRRYSDAAAAYEKFVDLHPLHDVSPHFSMRVVEIYEEGGFPILVLEAKKEFAASYGMESEYWHHFDVDQATEVLSYLKANLKDLANHYHALYQREDLEKDKGANAREGLLWYRAYLRSFPDGLETAGIHHQLADLLLENREFAEAAQEYERTAYDYDDHERAAEAGYAAIYAHRENQKESTAEEYELVRREAVASTFRFVAAFPKHEHAAVVMGAAADDLYEMKEFERAISTGKKLLDDYPKADLSIRRSAWAAIAHSSFDTADYPAAEDAYAHVLDMTPAKDDTRQAVVDNLAASIYKQGEKANRAEDPRKAADHFLRIAQAAPGSAIAPLAEYDAGAALIRLEDWPKAAAVLESFRQAYPEHELHREATRQMALVQREQGNLFRAGEEYERVAAEAEDAELRQEALLVAGELYEKAELTDPALAVYLVYVAEFPEPIETAVETRFKIAEAYEAAQKQEAYHEQLRKIVEIDRDAVGERTARTRFLAAQSALVLSVDFYHRFDRVKLVQPFARNLKKKQRRMDAALEAFERLVDYEVGEVTAAATFYMAEIYSGFSQALMESERPAGLSTSERQDYEIALEEEAFPFEERAIDVHEKNLELMATGMFNPWIEKSIARLGDLMPGRYAKFEASSGLIASIDTYVYQTPGHVSAGGS